MIWLLGYMSAGYMLALYAIYDAGCDGYQFRSTAWVAFLLWPVTLAVAFYQIIAERNK